MKNIQHELADDSDGEVLRLKPSLRGTRGKEMIVGIEDVTNRARELKKVLDERGPDVTAEELVDMGLVPVELPFEVPEDVQKGLGMI